MQERSGATMPEHSGTAMRALFDETDATGLADAIRRRDVHPREVLEHALARLDERNPVLNAVVARCDDAALAQVDAGLPDAPFAGVPFVVKDLGMTVAGLPATGGSRLFAGVVATRDTELVTRYRRAGFVVIGTTNTPELGRNPSTEPLLHGPTRNPHDLRRSPGGSSGGTAAAVAAGIVPIGHGNDGGGSIRIPASACGLVGLKPSRGRTTTLPKLTTLSYPLGINHVLTRSVRDTARVLDLTAGGLPGEPFAIAPPERPYADEVGRDPGRLRIGLLRAMPDGRPLHPDVAAVVDDAAALVASLGHDVEPDAPVIPLDAVSAAMRAFMSAPLVVDVDARLAELGRELRDDDLEPMTRMIYEDGRNLRAADLVRAAQQAERAGREVGAWFSSHDVLLTATLALPAPPLGLLDTTNLAAMREHAAAYSVMTAFANVTGQPAISLPLGHDRDGVPVGVQLVAANGREDVLVRLAAQIEAARPWPITPVWNP